MCGSVSTLPFQKKDSMRIEVICPGCQKRYRVSEGAVGKKLRCKACGTSIVVESVERDQFEDLGDLAAMAPVEARLSAAEQVARRLFCTIMLIGGAAGGLAAIVAIIFAILHFTSSKPEAKGEASVKKSARRSTKSSPWKSGWAKSGICTPNTQPRTAVACPRRCRKRGIPNSVTAAISIWRCTTSRSAKCRCRPRWLWRRGWGSRCVGEHDYDHAVWRWADQNAGQARPVKANQESADAETNALLWLASEDRPSRTGRRFRGLWRWGWGMRRR